MINEPVNTYVNLKDVASILQTHPYIPSIGYALQDLPKYELPTNSEAEQLLTVVCKFVWDVKEDFNVDPQGRALRFLNQIDGLPEWWATHKKTEREEKLEKVAAALSLGGKATPEMMPVAERVLQALGL
jgi:hypothetical protein